MLPQIEATLAELRSVVGAKNDAELARRLKIDQSTISSWKARGRVPQKFTKLLEESEAKPQPPEVWPELQDRATAVALVRFILLRSELARSRDVDQAIATLRDLKPFWLAMHRAVHDLRAKMEALGTDLGTAEALLFQEDLRDPDATAERVRAQLAEDLSDNPWLGDYK